MYLSVICFSFIYRILVTLHIKVNFLILKISQLINKISLFLFGIKVLFVEINILEQK